MKKIVITIARSYGSGGRTLGKLLAKEFGIAYYDRELLRMASDESGVNIALFGEADETSKGFSWLTGSKPYTGKVLTPDSPDYTSKDNLFALQAELIKKLADKESCVIIGRCADYVLKDRDDVLRLFFYAPLADCLKRAQDISGEPEKELLKKIQRVDHYRSAYYKYYTGHEWNDTTNYDFCLNTSSMSYEKLVEVVKSYMEISGRL